MNITFSGSDKYEIKRQAQGPAHRKSKNGNRLLSHGLFPEGRLPPEGISLLAARRNPEAPVALPAHEQLQETEVQFVAALAHLQVAQEGQAQEGQVPHGVQDLVAHALFRKPQAPGVQDPSLIEDYGVIQGAAPGQAPLLQELDLLEKSEGAGRGDFAHEVLGA